MKVNIDTRKLFTNLKRLEKEVSERVSDQAAQTAANWLLSVAQDYVPIDEGALGASATTVKEKDGIMFGFNTIYAAVQDAGFPGEIVKPRRKKALFIPVP